MPLTRYRFRGRGFVNGLIFLPMSTPEIVLGWLSLLTLYRTASLQPAGALYPARLQYDPDRAHHVQHQLRGRDHRARLAGLPAHLEEAAMDLGANEWSRSGASPSR